ncbi:hypothetical protein [Radiobacillus deserti]|uniref:Uncharacterized protein n=1 Tax=Radiobacillus deserti TaxID=2594883 RepID=A0A516KKP8_9BACI|nr:hypothetical protein [Radiobacillus deserti]QDP41973.1 hypothetical protein FN924_18445 [Radiobacillus deserti]
MEWIILLLNFIGLFCFGLFIKSYLPSYMKEKGKNLATKEDVKDITKRTEEVKLEFQKEMANFTTYLSFSNDYAYRQYTNLYAKLYPIIIQSEYIRYFLERYNGNNLPFDEFPFIESGKTIERTKIELVSNKVINYEEEELNDSITTFNKKELCEFIIKHGEFASQRLLKLAVAYRYAHSNYSGTRSLEDSEIKKAFDIEEITLIKEIVKTIVKDYNYLRKSIKLDYSNVELDSGILEQYKFNNDTKMS